jgi:multidrug efflux system outer membrane protein
MRKLLPLLLIGTAFSACSLAPDYLRPASPVAEQWPSQPPTSTTEEQQAAAEIPWQQFFQSPTLQGYITQALEHNRDLRVAALNVEKAQATYRIERAGYFPKVDAQAGWTRTGTPENATQFGGALPTGRYTQSSYQANLAVTSWEIDLFGRVRSLNDAALEDYFATQSARDAAKIALIAETANAYLQWLADEKALGFVNDTLAAQEKSFGLIEKSYKAGIRSKLELEQARTTVEEARASQAAYTRAIAQDKNALAVLTGAPSAEAFTAKETLDEVKLLSYLPAGLPADVLLSRPDVMQAEHTLKSENANIGAARAAFFPRINLTAAFGFSSSQLSNLFSSGSERAWNFSPQASLPIFAGGENLANLDSAKLSKQIAVAQYEKAIQTAFREVADELATQETLTQQLSAQTTLVKATQAAYDLSYARYKAGTDNYLTALESQRALFLAQQNAIEVQRLQLANLVNLYKVLGGGLKETPLESGTTP